MYNMHAISTYKRLRKLCITCMQSLLIKIKKIMCRTHAISAYERLRKSCITHMQSLLIKTGIYVKCTGNLLYKKLMNLCETHMQSLLIKEAGNYVNTNAICL